MKITTLTLAAALLASASSAHAYTAAEMFSDCRADAGKKICMSYVAATWDTFVLLGDPKNPDAPIMIDSICMPKIITVAPADMLKLAEQAVLSRQTLATAPAATALLAGLRLRFNCFEQQRTQ